MFDYSKIVFVQCSSVNRCESCLENRSVTNRVDKEGFIVYSCDDDCECALCVKKSMKVGVHPMVDTIVLRCDEFPHNYDLN